MGVVVAVLFEMNDSMLCKLGVMFVFAISAQMQQQQLASLARRRLQGGQFNNAASTSILYVNSKFLRRLFVISWCVQLSKKLSAWYQGIVVVVVMAAAAHVTCHDLHDAKLVDLNLHHGCVVIQSLCL